METNKYNQRRYDIYHPVLRDSVIAEIQKDELKYGRNKRSDAEKLKSLGLTYLENLGRMQTTINGTLFYGQGSIKITESGKYSRTYDIYGKKQGVLIGIKIRISDTQTTLDIDQLYCTLGSMEFMM